MAYEAQIMQVMMEHGRSQSLSGFVQLADTYLSVERSGDGRAGVEEPQFCWVKTVFGILMNSLRSTYHSFQSKYTQRYLAEFEYRLYRRYRLPVLILLLAWIVLRTLLMLKKLLKPGIS